MIFSIRDYIYGTVICLLFITLLFLKFENNSLENDIEIFKKNNAKLEEIIVIANSQSKKEIEYVEKEVKVIEEKVVEKIKYIKEYKYDLYKTKCENGVGIIRRNGF